MNEMFYYQLGKKRGGGGGSGGGATILNQDKTITENGSYTADDGYTGLGTVTVSVAASGGGDIDALIKGSITEVESGATSVRKYAFYYITTLTDAAFPAAKSIGEYAFRYCEKLKNINAPAVKSIGELAFGDCRVLLSADFPLATSIEARAFASCYNLASINFPMVTSVGRYAFENCTYSLTSVKFPALATVTGYAFSTCRVLATADFSVASKIEAAAFDGCSKMTALILRSETLCALASTNAISDSTSIYIYVPAALVDTYKAATNWSTYASKFRALEDYTVDGTTTGELDPSKI